MNLAGDFFTGGDGVFLDGDYTAEVAATGFTVHGVVAYRPDGR